MNEPSPEHLPDNYGCVNYWNLMKLSNFCLITGCMAGIPIVSDVVTTEKLPVLFWVCFALIILFALAGVFFWATGDKKEIG